MGYFLFHAFSLLRATFGILFNLIHCMNTYLKPATMKKLGQIYNLVHEIPFWQGIMRSVRTSTGTLHGRDQYNAQRQNRNTVMIDRIKEWVAEAEAKNKAGEL